MEIERWAGAHYRVERDSSGIMLRKRQRRKAIEEAIQHGGPPPTAPHDVVRIYDREGEVVFEQDWGMNRSGSMAQEAQIVDDLLRLDVFVFRSKYGIAGAGLPVPPPAEAAPDSEVPGAF